MFHSEAINIYIFIFLFVVVVLYSYYFFIFSIVYHYIICSTGMKKKKKETYETKNKAKRIILHFFLFVFYLTYATQGWMPFDRQLLLSIMHPPSFATVTLRFEKVKSWDKSENDVGSLNMPFHVVNTSSTKLTEPHV